MTLDLYFSNGLAHVWNADDWKDLRKNHHIVGELVGTIPPYPRHSGFRGFPLVLMREEAMLLVEKGICRMIEISDLAKPPSSDIVELAEETEERIFKEQIECLKDKRIEQLTSKIDLIIAGRKRKLSLQGQTADFTRESMIEEEKAKIKPPSSLNILVQIPTEHTWPSDVRRVDVSELEPCIDTPENKLKYEVFKDLWNMGHYITAGTKFGGDFLVYPGDPVKFHAMYIVRCVVNKEEQLRLSDVVGFGRLGVSVNKLTVFAFMNSSHQISYQTVQWHETLY